MSPRFALLLSLAVLFSARVSDAQGPVIENVERDLRQDFLNAVVTNPTLHGVWVDVRRIKTDAQGDEFALEIVVDRQPEVERSQLSALSNMIKGMPKSMHLKQKPTVIDRLPFRQMVDELKSEVELSREMAGAALDDAYYYGDSSGEVSVILVGRVMNEDQREKLMLMGNAKIHKLFGDATRGIPSVKTKTEEFGNGIVQVAPSLEAASFCFDLGLQRFTSRNYPEAYVSFTRAHVESPMRLDIQYWRVVCLLGSSREGDAKQILQDLVDARPRNDALLKYTTAVSRSLEPIQGPLRWKLVALENSLLCKTCN